MTGRLADIPGFEGVVGIEVIDESELVELPLEARRPAGPPLLVSADSFARMKSRGLTEDELQRGLILVSDELLQKSE